MKLSQLLPRDITPESCERIKSVGKGMRITGIALVALATLATLATFAAPAIPAITAIVIMASTIGLVSFYKPFFVMFFKDLPSAIAHSVLFTPQVMIPAAIAIGATVLTGGLLIVTGLFLEKMASQKMAEIPEIAAG